MKNRQASTINKPCQFPELALVLDGDGRSVSRGSGHSLVAPDHVIERRATVIQRIEGPITKRQSVCIGERAKIDKWIADVQVLEVPHPLLTVKRRGESQTHVRRSLFGQIFDRDIAGSGGHGDGDADVVASRYSDL